MMRVLTSNERRTIDGLKLRGWLNSKDFKRKEELYYSLLDVVRGMLTDRHGGTDPRILAEIIAITIEGDATFRGWMRKRRNSAKLNTVQGWREAATCAGILVVERYERKHTEPTGQASGDEFALTHEELVERIREVISLAKQKAEEAEELRAGDADAERYTPPESARPELAAEAEQRLLTVLEEEMLIVSPAGDELGIPKAERDREVAKRALVRLRIGELRDLAREEGVTETGTFEQVAQRIAAKRDNDEAEIAELVLRHEDEAPERGYVSRLVGLHEPPLIAQARTRLKRMETQYVRVGVARWFICTNVAASEKHVRVEGLLRYYNVRPKMEYDDYSLASDPQKAECEVILRDGVRWLEIRSRVGGDTRALSLAIGQMGGIRPRETLPIALKRPAGETYAFDPRTFLMLNLLGSDLMDGRFRLLNQKLAHFESGSGGASDPRRPTVQSVRLGGQHLLSSRQACELIVAGRALLSISGTVAVTLSSNERVVCPFRIELNADHATVFTGFGTGEEGPQRTRRVHEELVARVRGALERIEAPEHVVALTPKIVARATEDNPDVADILPPPVGGASAETNGASSEDLADGAT